MLRILVLCPKYGALNYLTSKACLSIEGRKILVVLQSSALQRKFVSIVAHLSEVPVLMKLSSVICMVQSETLFHLSPRASESSNSNYHLNEAPRINFTLAGDRAPLT